MPTVYIVQEPRRNDLSSAQRYGKLVMVLSATDQPSQTPGPCFHRLAKTLRPFNPTTDFVCYAGGDPMALALALLALRDNGLREIQTLRWDRERDTSGKRMSGGYYVPVTTPLHP